MREGDSLFISWHRHLMASVSSFTPSSHPHQQYHVQKVTLETNLEDMQTIVPLPQHIQNVEISANTYCPLLMICICSTVMFGRVWFKVD